MPPITAHSASSDTNTSLETDMTADETIAERRDVDSHGPRGRSEDVAAILLDGVDRVSTRDILPASLFIFGPLASAVLGHDKQPIVGAAAVLDSSARVVAFAHEALVDSKVTADNPGCVRFVWNAIKWASGRVTSQNQQPSLRLACLGRSQSWLDNFVSTINSAASAGVVAAGVWCPGHSCDVILWHGIDGSADLVRSAPELSFQLLKETRRGVGLIVGTCPWGFEQISGASIQETVQNQVLAEFGMVFTVRSVDCGSNLAATPCEMRPIDVVLNRIAKARDDELFGLAEENAELLLDAFQSLPSAPQLAEFLRPLENLLRLRIPGLFKEARVTAGSIDALAVAWATSHDEMLCVPGAESVWKRLNPNEQSGGCFWPLDPGNSVDAQAQDVKLIGTMSGWQSTGLFALPGSQISVTLLESTEAEQCLWSVRIGCHTDALWGAKTWSRWPMPMSKTWTMTSPTVKCTSPFGGPLYLERKSVSDPLPVQFRIVGAIRAPFFEKGMDSAVWKLRQLYPAPFAEIRGAYLVFSLPSGYVRKTPHGQLQAAVEFWDEVVLSHCNLAGISPLCRPERVVLDVQISAGYMHSGYPIMAHLDQAAPKESVADSPAILEVDALRSQGSWGIFHELGHNRQLSGYTFSGTIEVTVNLFTLFTMERVVRIPALKHPWLENHKTRAIEFLRKGSSFSQWKDDPGVALVCYAQLVDYFGWDAIRSVLSSYNDSTPLEDERKIKEWCKRCMSETKCDLRDFFAQWGWPFARSIDPPAGVTGTFDDAYWGLIKS